MNFLDDETGVFVVLMNAEGQHSLWPQPVAVPAGWTVVKQAATRKDCLAYIEENWTDMRPRSLWTSSAN